MTKRSAEFAVEAAAEKRRNCSSTFGPNSRRINGEPNVNRRRTHETLNSVIPLTGAALVIKSKTQELRAHLGIHATQRWSYGVVPHTHSCASTLKVDTRRSAYGQQFTCTRKHRLIAAGIHRVLSYSSVPRYIALEYSHTSHHNSTSYIYVSYTFRGNSYSGFVSECLISQL